MMEQKNLPIGVFDSGLGGLTVLRQLKSHLPDEKFIYLGDTARIPYGSRSVETVQRYSLENTQFLVQKGIKMLIIACNTATACALELLASKYQIPIIGVVQPGVNAILRANTQKDAICIAATSSTISSNAYENLIRKTTPNIQIFNIACPLFVPLVEEGRITGDIVTAVMHAYLDEPVKKGARFIVLGCTHYPILLPSLTHEFPQVTFIDSAFETARAVQDTLQQTNLLRPSTHPAKTDIYVTDINENRHYLHVLFDEIGVEHPSLVSLQEFQDIS